MPRFLYNFDTVFLLSVVECYTAEVWWLLLLVEIQDCICLSLFPFPFSILWMHLRFGNERTGYSREVHIPELKHHSPRFKLFQIYYCW